MQKHNCHNREFPDTVIVQDGWVDMEMRHSKTSQDTPAHVIIQEIKTRVPNMVEIPFAMSKHCWQWDEPASAIPKGVIDPLGCDGCKWKPT